jgi:hypothetical protein
VKHTVASEPLGMIAIALSLDVEHPVYTKAVEAGLGEHVRLVA